MARKGNQQRNGVDRVASNHKKKGVDSGYVGPEMKGRGKVKVFPGEETPNGNHQSSPVTESGRRTHPVGDESKTKQNSGKFQRDDKQGLDEIHGIGESVPSKNDSGDFNSSFVETSGSTQANGVFPCWETGLEHVKNRVKDLFNGLPVRNVTETMQLSRNVAVRKLKALVFSILKEADEWLEKHRPFFVRVRSNLDNARDYTKLKVGQAYPVVLKWLIHFGNLLLLLTMVWLDFTLRGIDSFIRWGMTTFFSAIWCSIMSVLAMVGTFKFLIVLAIAALVGAFIGFTLGVLVIAISGIIFLWLYGSFWTTLFFITIAGLTFMLRYERLALSVSTVYSIYCAWTYVGWLGLLLAFNLSFLSSDILIYFLKNTINQRRRADPSEQAAAVGGHTSFTETGPGLSSDCSPGEPSTSGVNSELTSEEEVVRLLNCSDHYSVLGLSRYENVDASLLKKEYKKKAMLVHPDKNMGNEKAAEAFKKLQNAYEVLLDSLKRKVYDDELRREELLNYFRSFQSSSQKGGEHGFFSAGLARSEVDGEDPLGESRQIACKRCNNFHMWVLTKKSKSRARWCQDCGDFHQAKDGDGWLEQSSQPFFFGLLQKVDAPSAYVCADSKIYNATEWYICQGMRCPANTHKPSFHVNTSIASKFSSSKGSSSGQRSGRGPSSNMEENMTEEEFLEWLQNAVQSGLFDNVNGDASAETPSGKAGHVPKSSGGGGVSGSGNKRKKKGKKQW